MIFTIYKPVGASNPMVISSNYFENDIPFGRTIDTVPYNDFKNILGEAEQREAILRDEIKKLKLDLDCALMRKDDSKRLLYLIEKELVVKQGINSFWIAEPDSTSRVGQKRTTPIEAIDEYMRNNP